MNELFGTMGQLQYVAGVVAGALVVAVLWVIDNWHKRERKMDPARERFIIQLIADINTDGFEALVEGGVISREEADMVYKRLGNHLKAYDLLPRRTLTIPQEIRKRLWDTWTNKKFPLPPVNGGKKKRDFA